MEYINDFLSNYISSIVFGAIAAWIVSMFLRHCFKKKCREYSLTEDSKVINFDYIDHEPQNYIKEFAKCENRGNIFTYNFDISYEKNISEGGFKSQKLKAIRDIVQKYHSTSASNPESPNDFLERIANNTRNDEQRYSLYGIENYKIGRKDIKDHKERNTFFFTLFETDSLTKKFTDTIYYQIDTWIKEKTHPNIKEKKDNDGWDTSMGSRYGIPAKEWISIIEPFIISMHICGFILIYDEKQKNANIIFNKQHDGKYGFTFDQQIETLPNFKTSNSKSINSITESILRETNYTIENEFRLTDIYISYTNGIQLKFCGYYLTEKPQKEEEKSKLLNLRYNELINKIPPKTNESNYSIESETYAYALSHRGRSGNIKNSKNEIIKKEIFE